ncbi:hypothetical protein COCC4DRAFT_32292 [Bipolaris maydis ATCC 48331]|uniref:Uncharacterized protein n=2 Tax=Cochliobolus heterostrophus TaxID=5016 RepID=M2SUH5_COCH5|nr:uncharacterized protein COCC4DRAFT_32292 [Bipolaris maydis ATCC 48331]EMD88995.1 hypothetical protein COCHEDRAFT_1022556 [Bipolaris maydis C5]ENI05286.1 hypothetical protein COCC4DRAFT_32292 [Bipolaris maydis ATCC 48331]
MYIHEHSKWSVQPVYMMRHAKYKKPTIPPSAKCAKQNMTNADDLQLQPRGWKQIKERERYC